MQATPGTGDAYWLNQKHGAVGKWTGLQQLGGLSSSLNKNTLDKEE